MTTFGMGTSTYAKGYTWAEVIKYVGADLPLRRSFDNSIEPFDQCNAHDDVGKRQSVYSTRTGDWSNAAAGAKDDALMGLFNSWPDDHPGKIIVEHEPENDGQADHPEQWTALQEHVRTLVDEANTSRPAGMKLRFGGCLMGWTANKSDREKWEVADGTWDFLAFDAYSWPNESVKTVESLFDGAVAWCNQLGINFNVSEHGIARDLPNRLAWILNGRIWLDSVGCKWASYWNNYEMVLTKMPTAQYPDGEIRPLLWQSFDPANIDL